MAERGRLSYLALIPFVRVASKRDDLVRRLGVRSLSSSEPFIDIPQRRDASGRRARE